jgi:hypothetical protein
MSVVHQISDSESEDDDVREIPQSTDASVSTKSRKFPVQNLNIVLILESGRSVSYSPGRYHRL